MKRREQGASPGNEAPQDFRTGFTREVSAVSIGECTTAAMEHTTAIACRRCGSLGPHTEQPGTGPHRAKLVCCACSGFIRWLPSHPAAVRAARTQHYQHAWMATLAPTEKQLAFLRSLGDTGATPTNRAEASTRIDGLLHTQTKEA